MSCRDERIVWAEVFLWPSPWAFLCLCWIIFLGLLPPICLSWQIDIRIPTLFDSGLFGSEWLHQHGTTGTSVGFKQRSCWLGLGRTAVSWCGTVSLCLVPMHFVYCKYHPHPHMQLIYTHTPTSALIHTFWHADYISKNLTRWNSHRISDTFS